MAVHWGQVVVDTGASDPPTHLLPVGDTLTRPGRLLGYAEPGEILASPEIERPVGGWYELRARAELPGIGQPDPIGAYSVIGLKPLGSPVQLHAQRPLSRFVGREREMAVLDSLLERVREGRGQVVGMIGEPGVGKSRLCYEVIRAHQTHDWLILETSAESYGQTTSYLPVIELLKAYFQIANRDAVTTRRHKVTDALHTLGQSLASSLPAVLTLLDVPVEDAAWQALDPPRRRQQLLAAIKRLLIRQSQLQPILLIAENLHWIDGETQALLDSLVEGLPTARLLLLVTYRPDYQHGWTSKTYYTQLRLDPLPPGPAQELLNSLLGEDVSLVPLMQSLLQRTEGNPFFLEESVQTLVETQILVGARGGYRLAKAIQSLQVPATVQAVLVARMDRLPLQEKRLLQIAAVIGMEVPYALVQAVAELPEAELHHGLAHLQATEFLYEANLFPDLAFTFKHALTHEVAYGSLLPERRRALHARIVEALEALDGDHLAEQVERLAHHALQGVVWDKAFAYYRQASDKAMGRSAYREVIVCCEQALVALRHLPTARDTIVQGVDLLRELYNALVQFGEFGRGLEYLREAETLAQELGDPRPLGQVLTTMTHSFWSVGNYDDAIACGQRALALTAASGDIVHQAMVQGYLGTVYFYLGDYRRAIEVLRRALIIFENEWRHERFGMSMLHSVRARTWLVDCLRELGEFAEGIAYGEEAVRIAEAAGHLGSTLMPQQRLGQLVLQQGDLPHAIAVLEQALAQSHAAHVALYVPGITASLGLAYALSGRSAEASPLLEQVEIRGTPGMGGSTTMLRLGEAYLWIGQLNDAFPLAEGALKLSSGRKERGHQAHALRLLGEIAAQRDPPEVAPPEDYFRQALAKAEELGMHPLQAHCHLGLGTLYAKIGSREQARAELSTAIELYRAMEMTFWLPQAEAALAQAEHGSYHP
jgi:tetratricopeptide (TPR) repeat protein